MTSAVRGPAAFLALTLLAAGCAGARGTAAGPSPVGASGSTGSTAGEPSAPRGPDRDYLVFAASEATDEIQLIRFGPGGAAVERRHLTGVNPTDPDGPHGLAVSPDGAHYYVSTAHGTPNGYLWKYRAADDALLGRVELGRFPASLQVSPDGFWAYVVNFNLHGEMVPSSVSIVSTGEMLEVARLETCRMPHGSRLSPDGSRHYSVCMMDDMLIEIDARELRVARHFMLGKGMEHGMAGAPGAHGGGMATGMGAGMGSDTAGGMDAHARPPGAGEVRCSPTWAAPAPDGRRVWVACNASNEIVEVDVDRWSLVRRIPTREGVYNLAATHDGRRLVATNKRDASVSVYDVASGEELARVPTLRRFVHGIAISDDDRYAFVSVEGYGAEPGTVEVIDLDALQRVASVDIGQMAGGIDLWRSEGR